MKKCIDCSVYLTSEEIKLGLGRCIDCSVKVIKQLKKGLRKMNSIYQNLSKDHAELTKDHAELIRLSI